jgi:hypothetical protein
MATRQIDVRASRTRTGMVQSAQRLGHMRTPLRVTDTTLKPMLGESPICHP